MKKILVLFIVVFICFTLSAEPITKKNEGAYTYFNVPVIKVYEHKDAYVVLYQKSHVGVGQVYLSKEMFDYTKEERSKIRALDKQMKPYMTVLYKDGEFCKVLLSMPIQRLNSAWAVLSHNIDISDKLAQENFEIQY